VKFLLDANMPRAAVGAALECGHAAVHVRDIGLGDATDERVEGYARSSGAVLVTRDLDLADIRRVILEECPGVLVLRPPGESTATQIADVRRRFLSSDNLIQSLTGRLAILEPSRVRFRPALPSG
jgi:predicted nuclease of predicted toxin-antitoxin system